MRIRRMRVGFDFGLWTEPSPRTFAQGVRLLGGPDYVFDRKEAGKGSVAGARQTDTQRCKVPVDSRKHESSCQCLEVHRPTCNR